MDVIIGSARINEKGKASGGAPGDQKQTASPDYKGEVSMEDFYVHSKGWIILRAKDPVHAIRIASSMTTACNNGNIGYGQDKRYGVVKNGTDSRVKTAGDCSSLIRRCVMEATGKDPGDFTTANEASVLLKTGLFEKLEYKAGTTLCTGDILVTKTKGHTVAVTSGAPRPIGKEYYPAYSGKTTSIVAALAAVGEKDTSYAHRARIAAANGIDGYRGTAYQNTLMLNSLKLGKLIKKA